MALSQSALLEVLDALKVSDSEDVIRAALQVILQQLIEAEATAVIGAGRYEAHREPDDAAQRSPARVLSHHGRRRGAARSRSCGTARSSRRCWSGAGGSTRRCSRW